MPRKFFNAKAYFWMFLLFLISWRVGYAMHFFRYRPVWVFIQAVSLWFGILGTGAIILSMTYSLRRMDWIRWGSKRFWLNVHVLLGLIGPVMIEIHGYGKNFGIAGWSSILMWAAALSGFAGLYLKSCLAEDITEQRAERAALQKRIDELRFQLAEQRVNMLEIHECIEDACTRTGVVEHEKQFVQARLPGKHRLVFKLIMDYVGYLRIVRRLKRRLARSISQERRLTRLLNLQSRTSLDIETKARTSGFVMELFSLWRLIHSPLSAAFAVTVLVHIWAVWRYGWL
jgi:hypothetical protein